jgi:MYXO-CTERM domain-containing protein
MKLYRGLLLVVIAVTTTSMLACSEEKGSSSPSATTELRDPTAVIDQELMIALSKAKNFHHKARVYMSDGKVTEAIASVREILSLRFPANAPEADDVRNDARALLAKLLVGQNQIEEAMTIVKEGIAQARRESFFVANLYTVKGEIHEARAAALDANDPANKAKIVEEKSQAIDSYDKSNAINTELQKQLMSAPADREPRKTARGCGCASSEPAGLLGLALVALALGRRRQRR